jgi:hypothetical protein
MRVNRDLELSFKQLETIDVKRSREFKEQVRESKKNPSLYEDTNSKDASRNFSNYLRKKPDVIKYYNSLSEY